MKLTSSSVAKQTGERAAKVLVPERVMGPIESELRELADRRLSYSDYIGLVLAGCQLSDAAHVGLAAGWSLETEVFDAWSEAIEAAEALGL